MISVKLFKKDQSCISKRFLNLLRVSSLNTYLLIVIVVLALTSLYEVMTNTGMWSDISVIHTPGLVFISCTLVNMLSISVADSVVSLVGILIKG